MTDQQPPATDPGPATPQVRICRHCSVQSTTSGLFCPNCGKSYERGRKRPSRKVSLIAGGLVVLLLAGGATALVLKNNHDANERDKATAAKELRAEKAREAEEAEAKAQEAADETERTSRRELVEFLEKAITKDAKGNVKEGVLDGPIKYSQCTATGGGSTDDLTALTGTFECIAVNKENDDGTLSGYSYAGTAEWSTGSVTWKLGG